jgi:hypothetical protein
LKTSIAQSAKVNDPQSVIGLTLTQSSLALLNARAMVTPKLSASYKVSFYLGEGNSLTRPEDSSNALTAAVNDGTFTKTMQQNTANSNSALKTSSSPSIVTTPPVSYVVGDDSSDDDKLNDGEIAAAVILPVLFVLLFGVRKS